MLRLLLPVGFKNQSPPYSFLFPLRIHLSNGGDTDATSIHPNLVSQRCLLQQSLDLSFQRCWTLLAGSVWHIHPCPIFMSTTKTSSLPRQPWEFMPTQRFQTSSKRSFQCSQWGRQDPICSLRRKSGLQKLQIYVSRKQHYTANLLFGSCFQTNVK